MNRPRFRRVNLQLAVLVFAVVPVSPVLALPAANVLIYGPSLANSNQCGDGDYVATEKTVADDFGINNTVVDQSQWLAMSTSDFAAFDAIVIGDGGCNESDDDELVGPKSNSATWSAAVTGNITLNTFDAFCHYWEDDTPYVKAGADALVSSGITYAASGSGTGLYYSHGCRAGDGPPGSTIIEPSSLLHNLGLFVISSFGGDPIVITNGGHAAMTGTTEQNLSDWSSSTHASFVGIPDTFEVLAELDRVAAEEEDVVVPPTGGKVASAVSIDRDFPAVVIAGVAAPVESIPTLSLLGLSLLGAALVGAATLVLRGRNGG